MSQRKSKNRSNQEEDVDVNVDAVKECVRYIICREGSKVPIKRAEIIKHLSNICQTPSNQVNFVIIEANKVLKRVYGYKLVQVEAKSGIQYIVVLTDECDSLLSSAIDSQHRKLLVASLMHVFMSGGSIKEEDMWKFLSEAGLMEENDYTARKILTATFTRQMYLQFIKVGEGDLAIYTFEWGQRANEEVPKMFLLNKMATAFDKTPEHWSEQHKMATEDQEA